MLSVRKQYQCITPISYWSKLSQTNWNIFCMIYLFYSLGGKPMVSFLVQELIQSLRYDAAFAPIYWKIIQGCINRLLANGQRVIKEMSFSAGVHSNMSFQVVFVVEFLPIGCTESYRQTSLWHVALTWSSLQVGELLTDFERELVVRDFDPEILMAEDFIDLPLTLIRIIDSVTLVHGPRLSYYSLQRINRAYTCMLYNVGPYFWKFIFDSEIDLFLLKIYVFDLKPPGNTAMIGGLVKL